jgi:hypothetical protein
MESNFDRVRCYNDDETVDALKRMVEYDEFFPLFRHVFPDLDKPSIKELFLSITGSYDFQKRIVDRAVQTIINYSMDEFTSSGIENLDKNKAYLFVANHRDIVLDAALLQHVLVSNNMNTTQITFGSNLMITPFIVDLGKSNKMFTVFRNSDRREQLRDSLELSEYMRHVIKSRNESLWIAQRAGRTKDGIDMTQQGLLRMFAMSGTGSTKDRLKELNIVPLSISYEFEPCDYLKVNETCRSKKGKYIKKVGEDFNSIQLGIGGYKGRTKLVIGNSLTDFIESLPDAMDKKELLQVVASEVDRQVYSNYQLWPTNYIAYDLLNDSQLYASKYNSTEKEKFIAHMNSGSSKVDLDKKEFEAAFLSLYANPVSSKLH